MGKRTRLKRKRVEEMRLSKKETDMTSVSLQDSTCITSAPGVRFPSMSFESITTTATNFIIGQGQEIELSGRVVHTPRPGPGNAEIRNMLIGEGVDDCPACQRLTAKHPRALADAQKAEQTPSPARG